MYDLGLRDEIKLAHIRASTIWQDRKLKSFLEKYRPELFDALMDFVIKPDYPELDWLGAVITTSLPIRNGGHVVPTCFDEIMDHVDTIEDMRAVWLG